jgi:hypothetical protein
MAHYPSGSARRSDVAGVVMSGIRLAFSNRLEVKRPRRSVVRTRKTAPVASPLQLKLARLEAERPVVAEVLDKIFDRLLGGPRHAS